MGTSLFKNIIKNMYWLIIHWIHMYKKDLALNNLPRLICHKIKPNWTELTASHKVVSIFVIRTTSIRMWHKAVFLGGSSRRAKAYMCPAVPKMPRALLAFLFSECLRRQAMNLTSLRRVKALGDGPARGQKALQCRAISDQNAWHKTARQNKTQTPERVTW